MITVKETASGRKYGIGLLRTGHHQFMDRLYQFAYVPDEIVNCPHIITCGSDKMIPEDEWCFTLECDRPCTVYVLYADKQPELPVWLQDFERTRMNVTRMDSMPMTLKGYFSVYKKYFPAGEIRFGGNSPRKMIEEEWYSASRGTDYCMYSVAVREDEE